MRVDLLNDPLARFLPEFADMKVAQAQSDAAGQARPGGHGLRQIA